MLVSDYREFDADDHPGLVASASESLASGPHSVTEFTQERSREDNQDDIHVLDVDRVDDLVNENLQLSMSPAQVRSDVAGTRFIPLAEASESSYVFHEATQISDFLNAHVWTKISDLSRKELHEVFPRPSADGTTTPAADPFLVDILGSKVSAVDGGLYKIQDLLLDGLGPITGLWQELLEDGSATVPAQEVVGCIQRTIQFLGHVNATIKQERREALAKDLGKSVSQTVADLPPPTGKNLFGSEFTNQITEKAKV